MSLSFSTKDLIETKEVIVDGMKWHFREVGAGATLELNRITRESTEFAKRVEEGSVTPEDNAAQLDNFASILKIYESMLRDGTKNNASVKQWINEMPPSVIIQLIENIRNAKVS